ncbi:MAG: sulfite exporter TauE/SafE family protein [Candidatus Magasanikbacteria bacterium]|nr:sulfite exporter TauE/SafE family protein [Candidatus Magasanikbacteria bacterium]
MDEDHKPYIYKFSVKALTNNERAEQLRPLITAIPHIEQLDMNVEKRLIRIMSSEPLEPHRLNMLVNPAGFQVQTVTTPTETPSAAAREPSKLNVCIDGMTCRSCELTIERKWKKIAGVKKVSVNAATGKAELIIEGLAPSVSDLQQALLDNKYHVHQNFKKVARVEKQPVAAERPTLIRLIGLFALVLILGRILTSFGLFKTSFSVGGNLSFGAIFMIGLVAASSSCIAIVGGLLLSTTAKFNERYASASRAAKMRPVALFILGRVVSYAVLGGLLGVVGGVLAPSPAVTALIAIIAAGYMIMMGLEMLHIAPFWTKKLMPRLPKSLSHRIMDAEGHEHPLAPFGLGAATFFLPCGFTQALQLYALTTHSFVAGATALLAFALGTAPALFALGMASSSVKGKIKNFFFQFAGTLVIILGFWNIQNGLTILGYPLALPSFGSSAAEAASTANQNDPNVTLEGNTQVVKMAVTVGYDPNHFTIHAGQPVRWEIDAANAGGCATVLISRQLGIQKFLDRGINTIEFTPKESGEIAFSCSMGMYRGSFTVLPPA